ncbi:MAG: hypothetical protein LBG58_13585 [Planctomycetaceae bacterium]|jgi:hypothetical protein|nr:hypothetical protein [Planctomycetaceae bacterium]
MRISLLFFLPLFLLSLTIAGAEERKNAQPNPASKIPAEIDFFDAINQNLIEAKITAKNSMEGRVTVKNKSGVPLRVNLPEAFAAVPLAQFDDLGTDSGGGGRRGGRGGSGSGRGGNSGGTQSTGGGFGNMGGMSNGGGWSIPPEKIMRHDVKMVCLEYGKREPARHMDYVLQPLGSVTNKPEVHALCNLVGNGAIDQNAAQAAVWHYNNGLSWEELASKQHKPRVDALNQVPYFSQEQMIYAMNLGKQIEEKIAKEKENEEKNKEKKSPSLSDESQKLTGNL